jgi:hypothetical protein
MQMTEPGAMEAARIVAIAGGRIVGSTRLQKIGCLLDLAGAGVGFQFTYHLFGPYSERLSVAAADADALGLIDVDETRATWGGRYSIYQSKGDIVHPALPSVQTLAATAAKADSVELELAVTAAFLAKKGEKEPWQKVAQLKREKATPDRISAAKALYHNLARLDLPAELPRI